MRCSRSAERPTSSGFGEVGSEAAVRMRVTQGRAARGRRRISRRMETPLAIGLWEVYTVLVVVRDQSGRRESGSGDAICVVKVPASRVVPPERESSARERDGAGAEVMP